MKSNRKEAFRYTFPEEIPARFQIKQIDGTIVTTSEGEASIIDLSPQGVKMTSKLNIPKTSEHEILLSISFKINDTEFHYTGEILWQKKKYPLNEYGMRLFTSEDDRNELIKQLKQYSKDHIPSRKK